MTDKANKENKNVPAKKQPRRFGDVNEKIEFYPELEKLEFDAIQNEEITVIDAKLIRDFDSKFGKHDFMIIHFSMLADDGKAAEFTTATSGQVIIKRIKTAQEKKQLPLTGVIDKPDGKPYYDIN